MSRRCLKTHTLEIAKLKGVSGLQEVQLDKKPITGIFGPNGVGKSTILYALAAAYVAPKGAQSHDFKSFFPKLADDVWDGSNFRIEHTIKTAASEGREHTKYRKGTATTRWTPTASKRPVREVCFIGLRSVVPSIERHSSHRLSAITENRLTDDRTTGILRAASVIMNIDYDCLAEITSTAHPQREYMAIGRADFIQLASSPVTPKTAKDAPKPELGDVLLTKDQRVVAVMIDEKRGLIVDGKIIEEKGDAISLGDKKAFMEAAKKWEESQEE